MLAASLHAPSHVSLESALAYHGLIPEAVYQVASITVARSREFTSYITFPVTAALTTQTLVVSLQQSGAASLRWLSRTLKSAARKVDEASRFFYCGTRFVELRGVGFCRVLL